MNNKLYVIGVGPGDPELLTLKAIRILHKIPCICVPKGKEQGSSLALSIIEKILNLSDKEIIEAYFPMKKTILTEENNLELDIKWQNTVNIILNRLNNGMDIAFITIGDPTLYSTFFYLYNRLFDLNPDLNIEIIPGVSSINAAAARAKISLGLGDEKIAILPANYISYMKKIMETFDTVVLMKVHKSFQTILKGLESANLLNKAIYISRVGMEDEKIFKDILQVTEDDLNYLSLVVIKK